jgi:hypothetical protein
VLDLHFNALAKDGCERVFDGVTPHTIDVENSADSATFAARSFWSAYKLFTLVWL